MRPLALAIALSLIACKSRDASDPKTWIARLDDRDPKVRVQAVQQLRKLKAKQAAPQMALVLKDPLLKEDAALALEDLGGPEQVDALRDAVDTTVGAGSDTAARAANRTNARVAEALGNIGDARAGPALLRLARSGDDNVRIAAVEALGNVKSKDAVPELSHIVDDPTAPPLLIKRAVVALGQIGDTAGIPALAHALVIERQGVSFLSDSSFALFLMGPSAVEPLMKIAQAGLLKLRLTIAQSAALFGEPVLGKDILNLAMRESKGSQQTCVRQLAELTMPVGDPRQACDLLATQFGELSKPFEAARVCASDAPCWPPKLQDPDPVARPRAASEPGRAGAADAISALVKAAGEEQLLVRTAATR